MIPNNNIECSFTKQLVQPEPNGDIGGPLLTGVVVATAWLTVGATALYYLFALDPNQNLSGNEGDDGNVSGPAPNSVDLSISRLGTHIAERPIVGRFHGKSGWQKAFAKSILTICDVQTLVGLSLLIGGFLALSSGISTYHYILIVQTAWFAHVAQLTTLSILRHTKHNLIAKWARLLITAIFTGLLIWAIIPTIFFGWAYFANFYYKYPDYSSLHNFPGGSASLPGSHAVCYFDLIRSIKWHYENGNNAWNFTDTPAYGSGVASVVFVVLNLVVRFLRLQGWLDLPARAVRQWVSKWWKSLFAAAAERESTFQRAVAHIGLTTLLTARLYSDLTISVLSDVYWLVVPATWGTITLIRARSAVHVEDNKWTYAQILPVLLLLGALSIAAGSFLLRETPVPLRISEEPQRYSDAGTSTNNLPTASTSHQETTPLLHREVAALFETDYSNPDTGPWMSAAIALPCLHAAVFTAFFFRYLYDLQPNALSLVVRFIVPVLVGIPSSSFLFILLSLGYQNLVTSEKRDMRVYWVMMGSVWAATGGMFSGFLFLHHWAALPIFDFIVLGVGAVIVLVNVLAVVVSKSGNRARGAISI